MNKPFYEQPLESQIDSLALEQAEETVLSGKHANTNKYVNNAPLASSEWEALLGNEEVIIEDYEAIYLLDQNRCFKEVLSRISIRVRNSADAAVSKIEVGYRNCSDPRKAVPEAINWGEFQNRKDPDRADMIWTDFVFDYPIEPGLNRMMESRIIPLEGASPGEPFFRISPLKRSISKATLRVRFAKNDIPSQVWRSSWPDRSADRRDVLPNKLEALVAESSPTYAATFYNLHLSRPNDAFGIFWDWD